MLVGLLDPGLVIGIRVEEVEFVEDDKAGFFFFQDELGDLAILGGDACRQIDDENAEVGAADGFFRADGGEDFDGVVAFATGAQAGSIDEGEILPGKAVGEVDGVAGGAGDTGDDGALVLEDGIDERGFPGVRAADDGELDADFFRDLHDLLGLDGEGLEGLVHLVDEFGEIAAVLSGDEDGFREAEAGEIREGGLVLVVIDFVDDEQDGWLGFAELLRERLVDGSEALLGINDKEDEIGRLHGDVRLDGDLLAKTIIEGRADTAGIDEGAGVAGEGAGRGDAVPGDAGLIVDDGDFPSCEAVEKCGFPDIGASYDGDGGHGWGNSKY